MNLTIASLVFNLICTGTRSDYSGIDLIEQPYEITYRIDIEAEKWCESDCKTVHKIFSVQPIQITLTNKKEFDSLLGFSEQKAFVNRENGQHYILTSSKGGTVPKSSLIWKGKCDKSEFTGFPKFETKF